MEAEAIINLPVVPDKQSLDNNISGDVVCNYSPTRACKFFNNWYITKLSIMWSREPLLSDVAFLWLYSFTCELVRACQKSVDASHRPTSIQFTYCDYSPLHLIWT